MDRHLLSRDPIPPRVAKCLAALNIALKPEIDRADARFAAGGATSGILHSPTTLHRWLVACRLSVDATASRVREALKWREQVGADRIRRALQTQALDASEAEGGSRPAQAGELPGPHLFRPGYTYLDAASAPGAPHCNELRGYRAAYSHFIFGTTAWDFWARDQTPVAYRYIGLTDPSAILQTGDEVGLTKFFIEYGEFMRLSLEAISREQKRIVRFHIVTDLTGIGVKHARPKVIAILRRIANLFKSNYPETVERIFLVNAPWGFKPLFSVVRRFMPARTQRKIEICDASALSAVIDNTNLPRRFGGGASESRLQKGSKSCPCIVLPREVRQGGGSAKRTLRSRL